MAESLLPLRVVGFSDGTVVLRGYRSTVCGRCACDLPGAGQAIWEVRVEAEEAPPVGAQVHLEIAPKDFLAGVATLYGLPLVFLFVAVAVGVWAAPRLGLSGSSAALQIVSAGGGLLLSLPVLHILDRRLARNVLRAWPSGGGEIWGGIPNSSVLLKPAAAMASSAASISRSMKPALA